MQVRTIKPNFNLAFAELFVSKNKNKTKSWLALFMLAHCVLLSNHKSYCCIVRRQYLTGLSFDSDEAKGCPLVGYRHIPE
jgi:hypothetical protein